MYSNLTIARIIAKKIVKKKYDMVEVLPITLRFKKKTLIEVKFIENKFKSLIYSGLIMWVIEKKWKAKWNW